MAKKQIHQNVAKNLAGALIKRCARNLFLSKEEKNYWKEKIPRLSGAHLKKLKEIFDTFDKNLQKSIKKICDNERGGELRGKLKELKKNALAEISTKLHESEIKSAEGNLEDALTDI